MKMMRGLTTIAAALLLAGCASTGIQATEGAPTGSDAGAAEEAGIKPFKVKLEVKQNQDGQLVLAVTNENKTEQCDKFADEDRYRRGCIFAASNEMVEVEVKLIKSNEWHFTEFQICHAAEDSPQKPAGFDEEKCNQTEDCEMTDEQRADWLLLANSSIALPGESGRVDITQLGKDVRQFELRDLNWTEANYFYRIKACKDVDNCVCSDPGAQNTGRR